jgi:glutamyl-tRNA reductase
MRLFAVGISHRTAPVELRECVDFARRGLDAALAALAARNVTREAVVLSTCNRAEIYAGAESDEAAESCGRFISEYNGVSWDALAPHVVIYRGPEAADHLFRVAAGLDSLVVGEPQILGQVKDAFATATGLKSTGALTHRLFTSAFSVGKRVRNETGLGEGAVSVSYAAIALAKKIFGDLSGLNVLILGAGEMAKLTAVHLQAQRVKQLTVSSRRLEAAEALAAQLHGRAVPWTSMGQALAQADIVVTATGATEPVLTRARIEESMRRRRGRPLFVIDIALPRDVEPEAGALDQVFLYNIDDLQSIVKENLSRRTTEVERAELIVREEVNRFSAWMRSRGVVPTVVALRARFEAIRQAELRRLEPKIASMGPDARAQVDDVTRLIVEKLLLTPTEQLKATEDEAVAIASADALNRLFRLTSAPRDTDPDQSA